MSISCQTIWIKERGPKWRSSTRNCRNELLAYKVYKLLRKKRKVKVITLIRDPFSREISDYFHNPLLSKEAKNKTLETVRREILDYGRDISLYWFETDFNDFFKYDVYEHSFDKDRGAKRIAFQTNLIFCC